MACMIDLSKSNIGYIDTIVVCIDEEVFLSNTSVAQGAILWGGPATVPVMSLGSNSVVTFLFLN